MKPTTHEQLREALRQALAGLDPEVRGTERHYVVRATRGEFPVQWNLRATATSKAKPGDTAHREAVSQAESVAVSGVASSTSVDWYGTEMSQQCLQAMAQQFQSGVGVYPSHGGGYYGPGLGWDDEMGRTSAADMERANVADPADATEPGWVLNVTMDLDATHDKVQSLVKRLGRGQPIGLSIGGWFTEVRYIVDDDGDIQRIIVESVDLDHLAVVRAPANPDCLGLELLRDVGAFPHAHDARNPPEVACSPLLDSGAPQGHDRTVVGTTITPPTKDISMTTEQLAAALREVLAPVTQRLDKIEERAAAAAAAPPASDDDMHARITALEASNARQRAVIGNLTSQPQRAGGGSRVALAASANPGFAASEIGALLKRCEAEGDSHAMALREVVGRHQSMLAVKFRVKGADGARLREACDSAEEMLREICVAADADGTMSDWRRLHA